MLHIEIEPVWRFHMAGSPQAAVVMLGVLNEIRKTGKLTNAADHAQLSYRHVWNLIEQWSEFFGVPLVVTHRGKGTTLTAFGEKLVWAGQRLQARLGPQLENLAQELATEINPFLRHGPTVIRVHASHGFAVPKLRELLDRTPGIGIDLRYVSNQNSLVSLAQDACDLSGVHLPRGELRQQSIDACKELLDPREYRVISFVTRELGLMVKRGNSRTAFGRPLSQLGKNLEVIARARCDIEALRLIVLKAAKAMDLLGNRQARVWVSMAKAMVPERVCQIIDQAIQIHGATGISHWTPLAELYADVRHLRFADGPDEVHYMVVGRDELGRH